MTTYLEDAIKTRIVAMQVEVCAGLYTDRTVNAVAHQYWWQEAFPYWTNALTDFEPGENDGEENSQRLYTLEMRYIIGHLTEGYYGQPIEQAYADLPVIQTFFENRPGLQSANYSAPLTGLDPLETRLLPGPCVTIFENGGIGNKQVGIPIRLRLVFNITIAPKYG